jgi:serine protease Do
MKSMKWYERVGQQKLLTLTLLLFTLSVGIVIGTLATGGVRAAKGQSVAPDATPLTIPSAVPVGNEFTKLAKRVEPSVVHITAEATPSVEQTQNRRRTPTPNDDDDEEQQQQDGMDLFRRFFRNMPPGQGAPDPRMFRREQSGTGFIVDRNGYVITNNHVVEKMDRIKVRLHGDTREYRAKLIGVDPESDLAVLKFDAGKGVTPVPIGNSDAVEVGDWAVAIGSPFGLEATVTAGIVSATGRDVNGGQFQRFIQTDAAINPGNSGGPLLNIRGEVIGVNTMIATQNGGYQGIGFALPMNMAARVYNDIIKHGRVVRGSIGVSWNKNTRPETLKALGASGGVLVEDVKKGGPSDRAGIKRDDIIVALNGKPVKDGDDLVGAVADMPIGSSAKLTVDRDGKKMDFNVTIADRMEVFKDDPRVTGRMGQEEIPAPVDEGQQVKFGLNIRTLNPGELELTPDKRGVAISRVEPGSFADEVGLQEKDIIIQINRTPVTSVDVRKVQGTLKPGDPVAFRVVRRFPVQGRNTPQTQTLFLSGTLGAQ